MTSLATGSDVMAVMTSVARLDVVRGVAAAAVNALLSYLDLCVSKSLSVLYTNTKRKLLTVDAHCCHMGTASIKHPVPDRVKPSFVIFDIWALWRSALSVRVTGCQKLQMTACPVWHRILYSCTHMTTVGVKWLIERLAITGNRSGMGSSGIKCRRGWEGECRT